MIRRMDWLDWLVLSLLAIVFLVIVPAVAGRAMSPYHSGRPVLLSASVITEQRYLDEVARPALELVRFADAVLDDALRDVGRGVMLSQHADRLRVVLDRLASLSAKMDRASPPVRFSTLHSRIADLVALYYALVGEALSYYGDMDESHWTAVLRGLDEGRPVLEMLIHLVDQVSLPVGPPKLPTTRREGPGPLQELGSW